MYPVSDAFRLKMKDPQRVEHVRGTIGSVTFGDSNVIALNYSNRCSDTKDVSLGSAYIGQIQVSFCKLNITRGNWRRLEISLEYGLELDDEGTTEWMPIGVFTVTSAEWTATAVNIVASDCLSQLDLPFSFNVTSGNIFGMISLVASDTGVTFGRTAEEVAELPNGDQILGLYPTNGISTYRDFMSAIAQVTGGFITADRDGSMIIRSFAESEVVDTLTAHDRIAGSVFSDYTTQYDGISVINTEDNSLSYYTPGEEGVSIAIGGNPLLQYGTDAVKTAQRMAVANVVKDIAYTPFQASILNCPVYDLGDLLECEGGVAGEDTLTVCVMSIEWNFKHTTELQGYGKDPALATGQSKTDKALTSALRGVKDSGLTYYTYINTAEVDLTTTEQRLYRIAFATAETTTVTGWHNIKVLSELADDTQIISLRYYYDGVLISDNQPVYTIGEDGYHMVNGDFWLQDVEAGRSHIWEVRAVIDGGSASVDIGDVHALIQGQKMAAQASFDGTLECVDEYEAIELTSRLATFSDRVVSLATQRPRGITASDSMTAYSIGQSVVALSDSARLTAQAVQYERYTEDGEYYRVTEDGGTRLTEA